MSCCDFEPEVKFDCVRAIIKLLRSGDLNRDTTLEIVEHAACFLGSGAALLQGSDEEPVPVYVFRGTVNSAADELEALLPEDEETYTAVPWLSVVQILLPILLNLLKDEK